VSLFGGDALIKTYHNFRLRRKKLSKTRADDPTSNKCVKQLPSPLAWELMNLPKKTIDVDLSAEDDEQIAQKLSNIIQQTMAYAPCCGNLLNRLFLKTTSVSKKRESKSKIKFVNLTEKRNSNPIKLMKVRDGNRHTHMISKLDTVMKKMELTNPAVYRARDSFRTDEIREAIFHGLKSIVDGDVLNHLDETLHEVVLSVELNQPDIFEEIEKDIIGFKINHLEQALPAIMWAFVPFSSEDVQNDLSNTMSIQNFQYARDRPLYLFLGSQERDEIRAEYHQWVLTQSQLISLNSFCRWMAAILINIRSYYAGYKFNSAKPVVSSIRASKSKEFLPFTRDSFDGSDHDSDET
jgi:hypothetical protein